MKVKKVDRVACFYERSTRTTVPVKARIYPDLGKGLFVAKVNGVWWVGHADTGLEVFKAESKGGAVLILAALYRRVRVWRVPGAKMGERLMPTDHMKLWKAACEVQARFKEKENPNATRRL
jgi:hypothetical protein